MTHSTSLSNLSKQLYLHVYLNSHLPVHSFTLKLLYIFKYFFHYNSHNCCCSTASFDSLEINLRDSRKVFIFWSGCAHFYCNLSVKHFSQQNIVCIKMTMLKQPSVQYLIFIDRYCHIYYIVIHPIIQ